jgi:hypothetical protein
MRRVRGWEPVKLLSTANHGQDSCSKLWYADALLQDGRRGPYPYLDHGVGKDNGKEMHCHPLTSPRLTATIFVPLNLPKKTQTTWLSCENNHEDLSSDAVPQDKCEMLVLGSVLRPAMAASQEPLALNAHI